MDLKFQNEFEQQQAEEIARLTSLNQNLVQENAAIRKTFNQTSQINEQLARLKAGELVTPEVEVVFIYWLEKHYAEATQTTAFSFGDLRKAFMAGFKVALNIPLKKNENT